MNYDDILKGSGITEKLNKAMDLPPEMLPDGFQVASVVDHGAAAEQKVTKSTGITR